MILDILKKKTVTPFFLLLGEARIVMGVTTQGRGDLYINQHITSYTVHYGMDGAKFQVYQEPPGIDKVSNDKSHHPQLSQILGIYRYCLFLYCTTFLDAFSIPRFFNLGMD